MSRHRGHRIALAAALAAVFGILCPPGSARAFSKLDRGTSGAVFLKLPPSARAAGMGEAYSAIADDVYSIYYNPAGLAGINRVEVAGMRSSQFQDTSHNFGAIAVPLLSWVDTRRRRNEFGVLALSLTSLSVAEIERRGLVETDEPVDTFGAQDFAYTLGYGYAWSQRLSLGGSFQMITQDIDSTGAKAYAVDGGVQYRRGRLRAASGFRHAGTAVKLGSGAGAPLPFELYFGGGYEIKPDWMGLVEWTIPRDDAWLLALGTEYRRNLARGVTGSFRMGFNTEKRGAEGFNGFSLGAGLRYGKMDFDFAWVPYGDLGNTFQYSILFKF